MSGGPPAAGGGQPTAEPTVAPQRPAAAKVWAESRSRGSGAASLPSMDRFGALAVTHMLVVADAAASRDWRVAVLDASVYGGTSVPTP